MIRTQVINRQYTNDMRPLSNEAQVARQSEIYNQPPKFADAIGNMYGSFGNAYGQLGQGMASGYGNIAQSNAMAEAARQTGLGGIASAMLAGYGNAANAAYGAYANQQTAYMKALSDMHGYNQSSLSQLGQSRNNALAGLADAYSNAGSGLGRAAAVGDLDLSFSSNDTTGGGGTISANNGDVLNGVYGFPDSSSNMSLTASRSSDNRMVPDIANQSFGGLADTRRSLDDPSYLMSARIDGRDGLDRLDAQQYSSRYAPFSVLNSLYPQMLNMGRMGVAASGAGMNQFYGNQGGALSGLNQMGQRLSSQMTRAMNDGGRSINSMFDQTVANMPEFQTPLERAQAGQQALEYIERVKERQKMELYRRYMETGQPYLVPLFYRNRL